MSESEREPDGITDDDLPEDLRPGDDNPLAEPLDTDEVEIDDLDMGGGKTADESGDRGDSEEEDAEDASADEEE